MKRNRTRVLLLALAGWSAVSSPAWSGDKKKEEVKSPLDLYIESTLGPNQGNGDARTPGSLWSPGASLNDIGRDPRASRLHDLVTITVSENASATSTGATKTQRNSATKASVNAIAGHTPIKAGGALLDLSNNTSLDAQGTTTRTNQLTTTVSARVTHVLPNGNLVVEGVRQIGINSEQQTITLRGIVRPTDLAADNSVLSERLAMLDVRVNGKGVVGDAIRRPNFLYRLLLGLLPF
jgi:flagellar L-ring protein precursor FlgH